MTINLHGKEYVEVKDRVAAAHAEDSYSMLREETFSMGGREYVRVYIDVKGKQYIGTAECKYNAAPKSPDGMSPFECGETSALGRALGFAGYGVVDSIASADEVVSNQQQGQQRAPITEQQIASIRKQCEHLGKPMPELAEVSYVQARTMIEELNKQSRELRDRQEQKAAQPLANGNGSMAKPKAHTLPEVKAFFTRLKYREGQWRGFKSAELGMDVSDEGLTDDELETLWRRLTRTDEDMKARAGAVMTGAN